MFVLFCNDFLGGSAPGGLVTAFSVDNFASHAGKSLIYARLIFSLLLLLFMSRLLRGQVFLLVRLEVLASCTGRIVHGGLPQVLDNLQVSGSSFFYCFLVSCLGFLRPSRSGLCADPRLLGSESLSLSRTVF